MKLKINFLLTVLMFCYVFNAKSQIRINNPSQFEKIKKGITYVVMKDTSSEKVKEYMKVFKDYWTISKFEFINSANLSEKYFVKGNSFIEITNRTIPFDGYFYWLNESSVISSPTSSFVRFLSCEFVA